MQFLSILRFFTESSRFLISELDLDQSLEQMCLTQILKIFNYFSMRGQFVLFVKKKYQKIFLYYFLDNCRLLVPEAGLKDIQLLFREDGSHFSSPRSPLLLPYLSYQKGWQKGAGSFFDVFFIFEETV